MDRREVGAVGVFVLNGISKGAVVGALRSERYDARRGLGGLG